MIIETERLFLREMMESDFDALYEVLADSDIMEHYPYTFDEARVRNWISRNMERYQKDGFGLWAVVLKETGEMIGDCGITMQNIHGQMLPEVGYHIRADRQRKGYATEAAAACIRYAFEKHNFPAVYSYMKYTNIFTGKDEVLHDGDSFLLVSGDSIARKTGFVIQLVVKLRSIRRRTPA